jgi:two-component system, chemotaxis family, CheB/CheR fusion protein
MLRNQSGHDFFCYKQGTILRGIEQRMMINRITSEKEYVSFLERHPEEFARLHRELLIGVTRFFRDRGAFEALNTLVLSKLFEPDRLPDSLRFWVLGCSTGEEVYSLAILAQEHIEACRDQPKLTVFATDIQPEALARARWGVYPPSISKNISKERLDRFFVPHDQGYKVKPSIREPIIFADHSIVDDIPFSRLDLVTCRNLLIYLQSEAQERALELIHYALKPDGFLFLGQSESVGFHDSLFRQVSREWNIYQRVSDTPVPKTKDAAESDNRERRRLATLKLVSIPLPDGQGNANSSHSVGEERLDTNTQSVAGAREEERFRNEELQYTNEELQSTNEELETSRDELYSANQDLQNRCSALEVQLEEYSLMNDDLSNLFNSLEIGMIFLDLDLKISRYTQAATRIVYLIPADVGRSFADLSIRLEMAQLELVGLVEAVLRDLKTCQQDVRHLEGHWYSMTIKPFRRSNNSIQGVVLIFLDLAGSSPGEVKSVDTRHKATGRDASSG